MKVNLQFREWLPPVVKDELDQLVASITAAYHKSHTIADLHKSAQFERVTVNHLHNFGISNPAVRVPGGTITYDVANTSGGVMGTITWGSEFRLAGAFTNPATGQHRLITFVFDDRANRWREVCRSAADSGA